MSHVFVEGDRARVKNGYSMFLKNDDLVEVLEPSSLPGVKVRVIKSSDAANVGRVWMALSADLEYLEPTAGMWDAYL